MKQILIIHQSAENHQGQKILNGPRIDISFLYYQTISTYQGNLCIYLPCFQIISLSNYEYINARPLPPLVEKCLELYKLLKKYLWEHHLHTIQVCQRFRMPWAGLMTPTGRIAVYSVHSFKVFLILKVGQKALQSLCSLFIITPTINKDY